MFELRTSWSEAILSPISPVGRDGTAQIWFALITWIFVTKIDRFISLTTVKSQILRMHTT